MKLEGESLQLAEQIGRKIVNHPLTEADIGVGVGHADRPTEQENQNCRPDAPANQVDRRMRAGKQVGQARQNR